MQWRENRASAGLVGKNHKHEIPIFKMDEEVKTCPLCLCDYKDPRALPCLHTFCLNCLSDVLNNLSYEVSSLHSWARVVHSLAFKFVC